MLVYVNQPTTGDDYTSVDIVGAKTSKGNVCSIERIRQSLESIDWGVSYGEEYSRVNVRTFRDTTCEYPEELTLRVIRRHFVPGQVHDRVRSWDVVAKYKDGDVVLEGEVEIGVAGFETRSLGLVQRRDFKRRVAVVNLAPGLAKRAGVQVEIEQPMKSFRHVSEGKIKAQSEELDYFVEYHRGSGTQEIFFTDPFAEDLQSMLTIFLSAILGIGTSALLEAWLHYGGLLFRASREMGNASEADAPARTPADANALQVETRGRVDRKLWPLRKRTMAITPIRPGVTRRSERGTIS
jgi:hypothetical protein